jgi:hypothetical protein
MYGSGTIDQSGKITGFGLVQTAANYSDGDGIFPLFGIDNAPGDDLKPPCSTKAGKLRLNFGRQSVTVQIPICAGMSNKALSLSQGHRPPYALGMRAKRIDGGAPIATLVHDLGAELTDP